MEVNIAVNVAGWRIKNPVMPAAGCFGYGVKYAELLGLDLNQLGAVVTTTTTLEPCEGNPQPRSYRIPGLEAIINRIGLENPGIKAVIEKVLPLLLSWGLNSAETPLIISIAGKTVEEFARIASMIDNINDWENLGIEINISCPNVDEGRMVFGVNPIIAAQVVQAVRSETELPLITKLTPNVSISTLKAVAEAVVNAGSNALSMINTVKAREKIRRGLHAGQWIVGGLSGKAIKPKGLQMVAEIALMHLGVPIIGIGGISNWQDALDYIESGANAVEVGSANFANPFVMLEIIKGIMDYLVREGIDDVNKLVGRAIKSV